jgi:hypothetical protein
MASTDGTNWSSLSSAPSGITGPTVALYNVVYGNNLFVAVGTYNESTSTQEIAYDGLIATSPDALNWSILPYTSNYLSGITYGGGQFVAVGREGSILTSTDGTTWAPQSVPQLDASETPYLITVLYAENHTSPRATTSASFRPPASSSRRLTARHGPFSPSDRTSTGSPTAPSRASGPTSPSEGNEHHRAAPRSRSLSTPETHNRALGRRMILVHSRERLENARRLLSARGGNIH